MKTKIKPEQFLNVRLFMMMQAAIFEKFNGKKFAISVRYWVGGKEHNKDWVATFANGRLDFNEMVAIDGLEKFEIISTEEVVEHGGDVE